MFENRRRSKLGVLLGTLGVAFAASGLTLWFVLYGPHTTALNQIVLGIVVHVMFGYIVVMSGIVIYRSELSESECLLAAKRCVLGAVTMGLLVIWRFVPELSSGALSLRFLNEFVVVSSVGAAAGVLIGLNRSQASRNRRLMGEKDDREETLIFLLRLLDHDIQNHLTAISGYADTIDRAAIDSRRDPVAGIQTRTGDIERLLETANVVLESETDPQGFERMDLSTILREQVSVLRTSNPRVDIEANIDPGLYVDANQFLGEIFYNLLDNAVVHNRTRDLNIVVSATATGDRVLVEIADDGSGIPERIRSEIFDPGVRADGSEGDGIGLYLVRKLVTSYGGQIAVRDGRPTGTRFRLAFPKC